MSHRDRKWKFLEGLMRLEILLQHSLEHSLPQIRPPFVMNPFPFAFLSGSAPLQLCPDMTRLCCVIDTHLPTIPRRTGPAVLYLYCRPVHLNPSATAPQTPFLSSTIGLPRRPAAGEFGVPVRAAFHAPCSLSW